jgi:hypothetical protein
MHQKMEAASQLKQPTSAARIRPVALPAEHGGWSMLLEPIVLGLMLAPTIPGLFLSLAATAAFLARHPFKLAVGDRRRKRRFARTALAERFAIVYLCIAILGLTLAIKSAGTALLLPLLFALPIVVLQLIFDGIGRSRALIPELAGALSTGALATAIVLSGGWARPAAFGLWVLLVTRTIPTILFVRARLRLLRHKQASAFGVIMVHFAAVLLVIGLASVRLAPVLAVVAVFILLVRAGIGLSRPARHVTPKQLGVREVLFGALTVLLLWFGYTFRL